MRSLVRLPPADMLPKCMSAPILPDPSSHVLRSYDEWSNMLFNAGQRETAAQVLKQGAHHNPRWFGGRLGAAIVLRDLGHTLDAIQLYAPPPFALSCRNN
jgi:hypothetical protein